MELWRALSHDHGAASPGDARPVVSIRRCRDHSAEVRETHYSLPGTSSRRGRSSSLQAISARLYSTQWGS